MAIQIPNPGTGNGATGDNEFVLWSKVKDNFSDQTNAASRLVGTGNAELPTSEQAAKLSLGASAYIEETKIPAITDLNDTYLIGKSVFVTLTSTVLNRPKEGIESESYGVQTYYIGFNGTYGNRIRQVAYGTSDRVLGDIYVRTKKNSSETWSAWGKIYTSANTTVVNGSLKPSSPVVKIHTDSLELNNDAERMGVTLNKRGVGDYLLQNTTGLRDDGGWYIELPQDVNGNPYFAVDYNELENNDIEVKTYKRIFDMNTFMFAPDIDNPVDIKEGRSIAIRFNDLPYEHLDDIQTEV